MRNSFLLFLDYLLNFYAQKFEKQGYKVNFEFPRESGRVDVVACKDEERIAIEIETGKSNIKENLNKIKDAGFDRIVLVATSPAAVSACQKAVDSTERAQSPAVELITWLDIS